MFNFLKNAFKDIKESAAAQHEVDKANFTAVKAESRANFYEAKRNGSPEAHKKAMAEKRNLEKSAAEERIKKPKKKLKIFKGNERNPKIMNRQEKEYLVEKIRTQYTEKEFTELDALKALNKKVTRPVKLFGYIFGSVSALIMGSGMSLIMTDIAETLKIGNSLAIGLIIGIIGLLMAILNYPIYSAFLTARRKKYADEIIKLSDKIMES